MAIRTTEKVSPTKRLLALVLAFAAAAALSIALAPGTAYAADGYLSVGDENVDIVNGGTYCGGKAAYDAQTRTLTLDGLEMTRDGFCITARLESLTVRGSATLTSGYNAAIDVFGPDGGSGYLTLDGDFTLAAPIQSAIVVYGGTLTVAGGTVHATSQQQYAILADILVLGDREKVVLPENGCWDGANEVRIEPVKIELSPDSIDLVVDGDPAKLTATVNSESDDKRVAWSVKPASAVSLYEDEDCTRPVDTHAAVSVYEVYAKGTTAGDATITVTSADGQQSASCAAHVRGVYEVTTSVEPGGGGTASADPATATEGDPVTLTATPANNYEFVEWRTDPQGVAIQGDTFKMPASDVAVTAVFREKAAAKYTITFVNWDGTELQSGEVAEGETPEYTSAEPERPVDARYTYTFAGWDPEVAPVAGEATYTAKYTATPIPPKPAEEFTVTFANWDGTVLQSGKVAKGEMPKYEGAEPTRPATAQREYEFSGWDPAIVEVAGDATYTATYRSVPVVATLTFDLAGGTLGGKTGTITIKANVGDTIKLPTAPTREGHTFKCWRGSEYAAGAKYKVEGDHAFTAEWERAAGRPAGPSGPAKPSKALPATGDPLLAAAPMASSMLAFGLCMVVAGATLRRRNAQTSQGSRPKR